MFILTMNTENFFRKAVFQNVLTYQLIFFKVLRNFTRKYLWQSPIVVKLQGNILQLYKNRAPRKPAFALPLIKLLFFIKPKFSGIFFYQSFLSRILMIRMTTREENRRSLFLSEHLNIYLHFLQMKQQPHVFNRTASDIQKTTR